MGKIITSYGINKMTGRVGDAVFSIEDGGVGMRQYNPISKQPLSVSQRAREAAFTKANQTWTQIGLPAATKWRVWGAKQKVRTVSGGYRKREGKDCFSGLYAKMLQVNPQAAIPLPPVGVFTGDTPSLSVEIRGGVAIWTSTGANAVGVTTELMAQEIPSAVALASAKAYKTLGFFTFTAQGLSTDFDLDPSYYAFAYQFIEKGTGHVAGFVELGTRLAGLAVVDGGTDEASSSDEGPVQVKEAA